MWWFIATGGWSRALCGMSGHPACECSQCMSVMMLSSWFTQLHVRAPSTQQQDHLDGCNLGAKKGVKSLLSRSAWGTYGNLEGSLISVLCKHLNSHHPQMQGDQGDITITQVEKAIAVNLCPSNPCRFFCVARGQSLHYWRPGCLCVTWHHVPSVERFVVVGRRREGRR